MVWIGVSCDPVLFGVFGLSSGIVGCLLGVFKPNGHGVISWDRVRRPVGIQVSCESSSEPASTKLNWTSPPLVEAWPKISAQLLAMMQGSFVNMFENRHTDTATCNDICTFVKTTSWFWKLDFTNERRTSVCISLFYELWSSCRGFDQRWGKLRRGSVLWGEELWLR